MQVIKRFKGEYPFGLLTKETTYVQVLKQNLSQSQIHTYQLKSVLLKEMSSINLIKLVRIYRQDSNLMLLYEYQKTSLLNYIQSLPKSTMTLQHYRELIASFRKDISSVIHLLVHFQIKVDLRIENLAAVEEQEHRFTIKLFVEPDAEFMALRLPMKYPDRIRYQIQENRNQLIDFYSSQEKRLTLEFEEILETTFGKLEETDKQHPNFIINGSKLIFIQNKQINHNQINVVPAEKIQFVDHHKVVSANTSKTDKNGRKQINTYYQSKIKEIKDNVKYFANRNQNTYTDNKKAKDLPSNLYFKDHNDFLHHRFRNEATQKKGRLKPRPNHSLECNSKKRLSKDNSQIQGAYCQTADTLNRISQRPQKYKMKIITSHDIQVQRVQDNVQCSSKGVQIEQVNQLLNKVRKAVGSPAPLKIGYKQEQIHNINQKLVTQSRKSDLGPATSRYFDIEASTSADILSINQTKDQIQYTNTNHIRAFQEQNRICKAMKMRKSQQFCDKFRQVKSKAQQLLRSFAFCNKN